MPVWVAAIVGMALCLFETIFLQLFHVGDFALQLWLPLTLWLAMRKDWAASVFALVFLFFPIEWCAGGRLGLVSFGLILPFTLVRLSGLSVGAAGFLTHAMMGGSAAILHGLSMVLLLLVFDPESAIIPAILWTLWISGLAGAIATPILLRGMVRLEDWFLPPSRNMSGARGR
jgi:hypothetical protein